MLGDWRRSLCGGFSFRLMSDVLKDYSGGFLCTVGHLEEEGFLVVSLKNAFFSATIMHFWFGKCSFGQNGNLDPAIGGMVRCVDISKFLVTI